MNTIVFERVPVAELPPAWRARLAKAVGATVTVRIEEEVQTAPAEAAMPEDSLFGMWRDRADMADVAGYIRSVRADRFSDGTRPTTAGKS